MNETNRSDHSVSSSRRTNFLSLIAMPFARTPARNRVFLRRPTRISASASSPPQIIAQSPTHSMRNGYGFISSSDSSMCDDEDAVVVDTDDLEMLNEALPLPPGIVIPGEPKAKCDLDSVCDDDDVVVVDLNNLEMLNDILPIPLGVVIPGEPKASSFHISSIIRHEGADVSNLDELKRMNETFPLNPDISDVIPKESQQKQKQQQVSKTLGPNDKSGETQSSKVFTPVKGHPKLSEAEFSSCTVGENEIKEDKKIEKKQKRGLQVQSSVLKDEETAFDTQSSQPKLRTGINRSRKRSIFPLQRKRSSSGHSERREASGEDPNVNNSQRPRRGWRAVLKLFCFGSNDNNGNERTSASKRMFNRPVSPQAPTEIGLY